MGLLGSCLQPFGDRLRSRLNLTTDSESRDPQAVTYRRPRAFQQVVVDHVEVPPVLHQRAGAGVVRLGGSVELFAAGSVIPHWEGEGARIAGLARLSRRRSGAL